MKKLYLILFVCLCFTQNEPKAIEKEVNKDSMSIAERADKDDDLQEYLTKHNKNDEPSDDFKNNLQKVVKKFNDNLTSFTESAGKMRGDFQSISAKYHTNDVNLLFNQVTVDKNVTLFQNTKRIQYEIEEFTKGVIENKNNEYFDKNNQEALFGAFNKCRKIFLTLSEYFGSKSEIMTQFEVVLNAFAIEEDKNNSNAFSKVKNFIFQNKNDKKESSQEDSNPLTTSFIYSIQQFNSQAPGLLFHFSESVFFKNLNTIIKLINETTSKVYLFNLNEKLLFIMDNCSMQLKVGNITEDKKTELQEEIAQATQHRLNLKLNNKSLSFYGEISILKRHLYVNQGVNQGIYDFIICLNQMKSLIDIMGNMRKYASFYVNVTDKIKENLSVKSLRYKTKNNHQKIIGTDPYNKIMLWFLTTVDLETTKGCIAETNHCVFTIKSSEGKSEYISTKISSTENRWNLLKLNIILSKAFNSENDTLIQDIIKAIKDNNASSEAVTIVQDLERDCNIIWEEIKTNGVFKTITTNKAGNKFNKNNKHGNISIGNTVMNIIQAAEKKFEKAEKKLAKGIETVKETPANDEEKGKSSVIKKTQPKEQQQSQQKSTTISSNK